MGNKWSVRLLLPAVIILLINACAGRTSPAPVENVHVASKHPTHKRPSAKPKRTVSGKSYTVKKGDTLFSIAWRAGLDYRTLAKVNKIGKPYSIFPGQVIQFKSPNKKSKNPQQSKNTAKSTAKNPTKSRNSKVPIKKPSTTVPTSPSSVAKKESSKLNNNVVKTLAEQKQGEYRQSKQRQQPPKKVHNKHQNQPPKKQYSNKIKQWVWPTTGKVIAGFSNRENGNKGIDIGGKSGTKIVSAADGKVVYYGNALRGYGNLIIIKHNDDYLSAYAHNRKILVKEKDFVSAGQKIAEMGQTDSQNVKLHFEVRYRGKSVNPLKYLPQR